MRKTIDVPEIKYNKLYALCEEYDISLYGLVTLKVLNAVTIMNIRAQKSVSLSTIDKLCSYFHCQPSDIMELVNDNPQGEQS